MRWRLSLENDTPVPCERTLERCNLEGTGTAVKPIQPCLRIARPIGLPGLDIERIASAGVPWEVMRSQSAVAALWHTR